MKDDCLTAQQNDIDALYRKYIVMVRQRAQRILHNSELSEEVAQEVFIKFIKHRQSGQNADDPAALLYRMVTNLALNHLRDRRRRKELWEMNQEFMKNTESSKVETELAIRQVLAKTPLAEAEIASYYYLDGMEQAEIAELLSMNRRTVGRRLESFCHRARKLLSVQHVGS